MHRALLATRTEKPVLAFGISLLSRRVRIAAERVRDLGNRPLRPDAVAGVVSGGEMTAMPNLPGETAMMPPPTPLFAGRPVWYSHLPESSYRPAVDITASTAGTFFACITCLPVTGLRPPL